MSWPAELWDRLPGESFQRDVATEQSNGFARTCPATAVQPQPASCPWGPSCDTCVRGRLQTGVFVRDGRNMCASEIRRWSACAEGAGGVEATAKDAYKTRLVAAPDGCASGTLGTEWRTFASVAASSKRTLHVSEPPPTKSTPPPAASPTDSRPATWTGPPVLHSGKASQGHPCLLTRM